MARKAAAKSVASTTTIEAAVESPKVARARATRTRADVQDAFSEISDTIASQESVDPKFAEIMRVNEERVRKSVAGLTVEKTIQSLSTVGLEISRGLNQVSEILSHKLAELQDVSDAVDIQRNELTHLHQMDVAASSIDNLVAEYNRQQAELETNIIERKAAWTKEESDHARFIRERNEETEKTRRREAADFDYSKTQERKFSLAAFEDELKKLQKAAIEKQEALDKGWAVREEALKARETEVVALREQAAAFPAVMSKEVSKAEAILTNVMNKNHQTEMTLLKKDMETTARLANQEILALKTALQNQSVQLDALQAQLAAEKQVSQSVVLKALDSASGQRALQEVTSFASSQNSAAAKK